MKVFLSDLHLSDGKERDDFQYHQEFDELITRLSKDYQSIELVLLGDIFDLIRTQKYYESSKEPITSEKLREVKRKVMAEILENHAPFFETLKGFVGNPKNKMRYLVGNHDFGISLDRGLQEIIQAKYGVLFSPESYYNNQALGIWAEHGHRYDTINNTFNDDGTPVPYCLGDRIVIEIVDKFLEEIRERQSELGIDPAILNDVDNVRPHSAISNWLDFINEEGRLSQSYSGIITSFLFNNPGRVATLALDLLSGKYQPDLLKAAKDLAKRGIGKYIIFGHTHDALEKDLGGGMKHVNCGTWRKFIEPKGRTLTRMRTVATYKQEGIQFYAQEPYYYSKFNSVTSLSHVLFYEQGEGEVGPLLVRQEKANLRGN